MTYLYWITLIFVAFTFVPVVEGNCVGNEVNIEGKCFYSSFIARNMTIHMGWDYDLSSSQEEVTTQEVESILRMRLVEMSQQFSTYSRNRPFCPHPSCESVNVTVTETGPGQVNCRIYAETVFALFEESPLTYAPALLRRFATNEDFFSLQIEDINYDISNFSLESPLYCPPGNEKLSETSTSAFCAACLPGQYLDSVTGECTLCPLASYQDQPTQSECIYCTDGLSTAGEGSTSQDDCKEYLQCGPGEYIIFGFCQECKIGSYKPGTDRSTSCTDCDEGQTTYTRGTESQDLCVETCDAGWLLLENGTCEACPQGTFLSDPDMERECSECTEGLTTDGEGTPTEDLCYNVICGPGEERVGSDPGVCTECPAGSYNPDTGGQCVSCGDADSWRTEGSGATSSEQCRFYCTGGYFVDDSSSPAVCEICPPDTYKETGDYYAIQCTECPEDAPRTLQPGADSQQACRYASCTAGQYIDPADTLTCEDCDYGSYQPDEGPLLQTCQSCDDMQSTRQTGSTSSSQCEAYCPSGTQLTSGGQCEDCAIGYYKDNEAGIEEQFGSCQLCPIQYVTEDVGATSEDDCNIANCSAGYYLTESKSSCAKCPRGEYQDERYQTECKPCPDPESSTSQEGSTSSADCTVYKDRVRYAIRIKFDMEWKSDYYDHNSAAYTDLDNRIITQVDKTLSQIESYRQGLELNTLQEGSVDAHLQAKFYSLNTQIEEDLERVLGEAVDTGTVSDQVVDQTQPLPVNERLGIVYQYAEKVIGVPDVCPYGMYFDYNTKVCEDCPIGSYQPSGVGDICLSCPDGYSTLNKASRDASDCLLECDAGREADGDSCVLCEKGSYKPGRGVDVCVVCSPGQTTESTGATDCIASCREGQYSNTDNQCKPCPLNTYNPLQDQLECAECQENYKTTNTGSTSLSDCLDPCEFDNNCLNGGTCNWNSVDETSSCVCSDEYEGDICQTASDICARASPCQHSSTCVWDDNTGVYTCVCTEEYKGTLCEQLKNVCINDNPCLNGATCEWNNQLDDFSCICTSQYKGELCGVLKNDCVRDDPCLNGGSCQWNEESEEYNCTCTEDFTGPTCNTFTDGCRASNPCENGGSCEWDAVSESTSCSCTQDYTGDTCQQARAVEGGDSDNTSIYIGAGAGAGALILLIIVIVAVCKCRRTPKQSKPPLPSAVAVTADNNNVELGQGKGQDTASPITPIPAETASIDILPPAPTIPPPPIPESPPPPASRIIENDYPTPVPRTPEPQREVLNSPVSRTPRDEMNGKTVTTVAMSSNTERISHRTVQPPDSPHHSPTRRRSGRGRSHSPSRLPSSSRSSSANRLRRLESEIPEGVNSMPPMANPLLEENLPPADYPFDPPPEGMDYPDERRPHVRWQENGLVTEPPPYSKKDPSRKKGHKHKHKHSKAKKHVRIDTDRNTEHKLSVRSNASSNHTYLDIDGMGGQGGGQRTRLDYITPAANTRTVPGHSARSMTFTSPIYETLN